MDADCEKKLDGSIECQFVQMMFQIKDEKETTEELTEFRATFSKASAKETERTLVSCSDVKKYFETLKREVSSEKVAALDSQMKKSVDLCKCKMSVSPKSCLETWYENSIKNSLHECRLPMVNPFTLSFKKVGNKWISNPGPQGICDVVSVGTLEQHDPKDWVLVKFTQIRVSKSDDKLCEHLELWKPAVFSWKPGGLAARMPCNGLQL